MSSGSPPEAFISDTLFERGFGYVVVTRFRSNDRVESGVFLLDIFCLGVKDAMFQQLGIADYRRALLGRLFKDGERDAVAPCCARKLVEGAVRYATALGFQPHPDYKAACRVFGGIAVEACDREFAFGHKGKPFYIQGPYDSAQKCKQILTILKNRCGQGNFYYLIASNDLSDVPEEYLSGARVIEVPDQDRRR
jgi:hypothetical protein